MQEQPVFLPLYSPRATNRAIQSSFVDAANSSAAHNEEQALFVAPANAPRPVDEDREEEGCVNCSMLADFELGFWLVAADCCLTYAV